MAFQSSEMYASEGDMNIPLLQRDLQRKYKNVGSKVEEIWRNFTPGQRGKAMRETVGDGKVLRNSRDPGLGRLRDLLPDWNLEDITSTPDFFLDRLKFRVETNLQIQLGEGVAGGPGDRETIQTMAQRRPPQRNDEFASFVDLGKDYGKWLKPTGGEGRRLLEAMAAQYGVIIPAKEAEPIISRQMFTLRFYNDLMEEILDLGSESRVKKTSTKKPEKDTINAMANLKIDPKPLKASISELIAQANEQKVASEDYLDLLRSEPVFLNQAIVKTNWSRPELVPDDRGRILPLLADEYISIAFFEVIDDAVKAIVIWDYIVRLLRMLEGLDDKVRRPLILQELSNTCHLEYRRAQGAFRRQMSMRPGVAGKSFKRITTNDTSKIAMRGQPSEFTASDPQLHYILRLCHLDTSHTAAAPWIQRLDDHNAKHDDDRKRLVENQAVALGDLAIIVSFMHTLSSSIAMVAGSRKLGLLFTGRMAELDTELSQYKANADFGDQLVPQDNILEPGVAGKALEALGEYVVEQSGASLGSLYADMLQECLNDIEEKHADIQARRDKVEKRPDYVPIPAEEKAGTNFRVEQRREKEKTRPLGDKAYEITAIAPRQPEVAVAPPPHLNVKSSVASVFHTLFAKSEARGSVSWVDFAAAMGDLGFSVTPKGGSIYTFNPPESVGTSLITLHRPHASQIEGWKLLYVARRLNRTYGWDADTFEVV